MGWRRGGCTNWFMCRDNETKAAKEVGRKTCNEGGRKVGEGGGGRKEGREGGGGGRKEREGKNCSFHKGRVHSCSVLVTMHS